MRPRPSTTPSFLLYVTCTMHNPSTSPALPLYCPYTAPLPPLGCPSPAPLPPLGCPSAAASPTPSLFLGCPSAAPRLPLGYPRLPLGCPSVAPRLPSPAPRVGFVVCREPGRISLYVALPPFRPQPIGSRKQLEPRNRSAVHRDENFVS